MAGEKYLRFTKCMLIICLTLTGLGAHAQSTDDLINLLINQKVISKEVADSIRADAAIKAQDSKAKQKSFNLLTGRGMTLNGYTQIRYQSFQEPGKPDYMDIRRARLDLRGNITPLWDYRLQIDRKSTRLNSSHRT